MIPSLVAFVADKIAQEKGISYESVCKATKANAKKLFNINNIKFKMIRYNWSNYLELFYYK